jgi:hypothetical protein
MLPMIYTSLLGKPLKITILLVPARHTFASSDSFAAGQEIDANRETEMVGIECYVFDSHLVSFACSLQHEESLYIYQISQTTILGFLTPQYRKPRTNMVGFSGMKFSMVGLPCRLTAVSYSTPL